MLEEEGEEVKVAATHKVWRRDSPNYPPSDYILQYIFDTIITLFVNYMFFF